MNRKSLCPARPDFARLVTLARLFDGGREACLTGSETILTFSPCVDPPVEDGICVRFSIGGASACAWASEPEWLAWIKPVLPVPRLLDVPPPLSESLAAMTLAPWQDFAAQARQPGPAATRIEAGPCPADAQLRLFMVDGQRQLTLFVTPLPAPVEDGLAQHCAPAAHDPYGWLSARFDCYGGVAWLTSAELASLHVGDAVLLQHLPDLAQGEIWVRIGATMAALRTGETGGFTIAAPPSLAPPRDPEAEVMPEAETETETETGAEALTQPEPAHPPPPVRSRPMQVRVGRLTVPLSELSDLSVGRLLDVQFAPAFQADLEVDGDAIGRGRLVSFAGRLAVRIEVLSAPPASMPPPMPPRAPLADHGGPGENMPV